MCTSLFSLCSLVADVSIWATSLLGVLVRHVICRFYLFTFSSWLCCPLRFQNSPQTCQWESFLVFGNFSSFMTPSQGWVALPNSFVSIICFYLLSYLLLKTMGCLLVAWCPPQTFKSCFVEVAQHSNDLLMNCGGRKWSPYPIPPPS